MKQGRVKSNRIQSISNILLLGLIVLTVSIVICAIHVLDVQNCFRDVTLHEIAGNMEYTVTALNDAVDQKREMLENIASVVADTNQISGDNQIWEFVSRYNNMELFDSFYYIRADGTIFGPNHVRDAMEPVLMESYLEVSETTVRIDKNRARNNERGVMYFVIPVKQLGKLEGYILALTSFDKVFEGGIYGHMYESGDLFLMAEDGTFYAQLAERLDTLSSAESENNPNLFLRLEKDCLDDFFVKNIKKLAGDVKGKGTSFSGNYVDKDNLTQCYEIRKVESAESLCLVYLFEEETYFKRVHEVVYKALFTVILIVALTMAMIIYMWASSKKANDMIATLAYDDAVTGGKNDKYFRDQANYTVFKENYNIPYLLVRFDIVNFRFLNEAYGHTRADQLLKIVNDEAVAVFSDKELCCRMSADQFLLLARNDKDFDTKFNDLNQTVNEKARDLGIKFPIRFKSGIYQIRKEDQDIGVAIDRANAARKTLTGDEKDTTVIYSDKIIKQMFKDDKIESEMEAAITNNEFKVFLQPKWDIEKDKIYGGEALVRWIKPDGSRVFPDEFIPVFERNGFVEKLDLYMLEEVCKYLRTLIDAGQRIYPISVNQSRILVHNPEYINTVGKILRRYRIPPGFIELEITETVFQDQRDVMINTVTSLKDLNVHVSMDDFGSGYSSLNMLKDVPFDVIKIDRGFFSESITSGSSILILQKIVEMAEGLGIRVLCEGVETAEQVELLKGLGVSLVQGYYYSKPLPIEEYIKTYCKKRRDGKKYYDAMYERAEEQRKMRQEKQEELEATAADASVAVKQFKMNYKPRENESQDKPEEAGNEQGKKLSVEEQKILARENKNEAK